ncbi:MAG: aminoacyl-tRNA hydrolase, partial [Pseudomonadota bacterium]
RELARRFGIPLNPETKFKGEMGLGQVAGTTVRLLVPSTYMNNSGESVGAVARYFKIHPADILVVYDEMAFVPGQVRLKSGGGDNGHNGLKSVRSGCGNNGDFQRLRIGVGHPGDKHKVTAYLTQHTVPAAERQAVDLATDLSDAVLQDMLNKNWQAAMNVLHTSGDK